MDFISICWLIVKILAGVTVFFLILGIVGKVIAKKKGIDTSKKKEIERHGDIGF